MWRIDFNDGIEFPIKYEEVLMELSKFYQFSVTKEFKNFLKYNMKVSNREVLNKYLTKTVKKGVLGESSKKKTGEFLVTHSTLDFLKKWLEENFFIKFEPRELKESGFYNFSFQSKNLDDIIFTLRNTYGIDIQSKEVKENVYSIK
jgi:hypothetical protein